MSNNKPTQEELDKINDQGEEKQYVKVEKDKMDQIMDRLSDLEKQSTAAKKMEVVIKNAARMRKIDNKYVLGFSKSNWQVYNERERKDEMWCEVVLIDKKKAKTTKEMKYIDLITSEAVLVEIISQQTKMIEDVQGNTTIKKVEGHKTVDTGDETEVVIKTPRTTCVIDLPEIGEIKILSNSLNI